jgi:ribonuclease J
MSIKIHRGANHIGGCVTEISTEKARVFIDLGADLTDEKDSEIDLDGLTIGNTQNSFLLITHYHGDHIGRIAQAVKGIPIYMGEITKKIAMEIAKRTANTKTQEVLEKAITFKPGQELFFGDIIVTTYTIDHSAFDAYCFLIKAKGKSIFYTGDFRLHGPKGKGMLENKFFEKYINENNSKVIDYMICEGTNISREEKAEPESELMRKAMNLFADPKHKYVFILCSSTNIDRIMVFYHAYNKVFEKKRPFIVRDRYNYQAEILKIISESQGEKCEFYNFEPSEASAKDGYCRLIRCNRDGEGILKRGFAEHPNDSLIIYSMWEGYLDENNPASDDKLIEFLKPYKDKYVYLHTSGHADVETIQNVVDIIKPKHIIPIHTESPEEFKNIFCDKALLETYVEW